MKRANRVKFLTALLSIIVIGSLSWMVFGNDDKDIRYTVTESKEEKATLLIVEITAGSRVTKIEKIEKPDGSIVEEKRVTYPVDKNGEYSFIVYYKAIEKGENGEEKEVEKQENITYPVESIVEEIKDKKQEVSAVTKASEEDLPEEQPMPYGEVISIDEATFPDFRFRSFLFEDATYINKYGRDGYFTMDEISRIDNIFISTDLGIKDLTGIEVFTSLIDLRIQNNQLEKLDLRGCHSLKNVIVSDNKLTDIKVHDNFEGLICENNLLKSLDISNAKSLKQLRCSGNQLTSLDISAFPLLEILYINNNHILSVDFSSANNFPYSHSVQGNNQTVEIPMYLINGTWQSDPNTKYTISTLDNKSITYNSTKGQFTSTSSTNTTSAFSTNCVDAKGITRVISGNITFVYSSFVPVTSITGIPNSMHAGGSLNLTGTVQPTNASAKNITWSLKNAGSTGATLSGSTLVASSPGTIVVTAKVPQGTISGEYVQDVSIAVSYANPSALNCTINGTTGKNGWYTSNVSISPPGGYQISKTLGSGYTTSVSYDTGTTPVVYLRQTSTGILYSAKTLTAIKIDKTDPVISGISNGGSEIGTSKTVVISDVNLSSVLLYRADSAQALGTAVGTGQSISNGRCQFNITASSKDQYFKIVAEDQSGRSLSYTYTLVVPSYGVEVAAVSFASVEMGYGPITGKQLSINVNKGNTTATIQSIVSSDTGKFTVSGSGVSWTVTPKTGLSPGEHTVTLTTTYNGGKIASSKVSMTVSYANPSALNCTINGTAGKNGWYTSDVTITPPSGYQISRMLGSGYMTSLVYDTETTPVVYLRQASTGVLYSAKTLPAIKIDKVNPDIKGISTGGSEIASSRTITVEDVNLSSVLLYRADSTEGLGGAIAEQQSISNGKSQFNLTATEKDQYFKIVAEDASGRGITYTYTLIAPTYGVSIEDIDFETVETGYSQIEGKKLSIDVNKGNTGATIHSIVSSDTSKFTVSGSGVDWTVTPKIGLEAGKHIVTLTATYNDGRTVISKVTMIVKLTNPSVLVTIPAKIDLERVKDNEMFEATKKLEISLTGIDTEVYYGDFKVHTMPKFILLNTIDSDAYFTVQVYNEKQIKYTSDIPLAILNEDKKSQIFYVKAYKNIANTEGMYTGTMDFVIRYGETS